MNKEYCVAIRTLGKAGDKYQALLDSLKSQTIQPKKILVYIAERYDLPKETINTEEYITCPKGMIRQRALDFKEIDTEWVLFCDDDVELKPDSVERLFNGVIKENGDCICANAIPVNEYSTLKKIRMSIFAYTFPRKDDNFSFKILNCGTYTYNNNPQKDVMLTQSGAGPCCLCKMSTYRAIHFEDELWLDRFGYAYGEDMLFFYKMYLMGYKVLTHFNSGVLHLDAGTGNGNYEIWFRKGVALTFILPYRVKYDLLHNTCLKKVKVAFSMFVMYVEQIMVLPIKIIKHRNPIACMDYFHGIHDGWKYVHSNEYKKVPKFDKYVK